MLLEPMFQHHLLISSISNESLDLMVKGLMLKQIISEQMLLEAVFQHHLLSCSLSNGGLDLRVKGLMLKQMI
jgi:hypothetical protein